MSRVIKIGLFLILTYMLYGISGEQIVKKFNDNLNKMSTFSADYTQIQYWDLAGEKSESRGKIYAKGKDCFRVESQNEWVISVKDTVWRYSNSTNQVLIEKTNKNEESLLPGKMIFEFSKFYDVKDFYEKKIKNEDCYIVSFIPKKDNERFVDKISAYILKSDYMIKKLEFTDIDDNKTEVILENILKNEKLNESIFKLKKGENFEILDLRKKK